MQAHKDTHTSTALLPLNWVTERCRVFKKPVICSLFQTCGDTLCSTRAIQSGMPWSSLHQLLTSGRNPLQFLSVSTLRCLTSMMHASTLDKSQASAFALGHPLWYFSFWYQGKIRGRESILRTLTEGMTKRQSSHNRDIAHAWIQ
jgi:hypothetical protein